MSRVLNFKPKSHGWCGVDIFFKNHRRLKWQTIRVKPNGVKKKRLKYRVRHTVGYLRYVGKARLVCSDLNLTILCCDLNIEHMPKLKLKHFVYFSYVFLALKKNKAQNNKGDTDLYRLCCFELYFYGLRRDHSIAYVLWHY